MNSTALLLLLFLICNYCSLTRAGCTGKDSVSLQLNWVPQAEYAGFSAALEMGFFEEECLSVKVLSGGPSVNTVDSLASGVQFGVLWSAEMLVARQEGHEFQLIWQYSKRQGLISVTRKSSNINSFADLKGKKVGYWASKNFSLLAALRKNGLNEITDVTLVEQAYTALPLIETPERFDSIMAMEHNEYAQLLEHKKSADQLWQPSDFQLLRFQDDGSSTYESGVVVSKKWLDSDPVTNEDITVRFLKACMKGWIFCRDNSKLCVNMLYDNSPHQRYQMSVMNSLLWPSESSGIGIINPEKFTQTVDILLTYGIIHNRSVINDAYSNTYTEKALAAIILEAKSGDPKQKRFSDVTGNTFKQEQMRFCLVPQTDNPTICYGKGSKRQVLAIVLPISLFVFATGVLGACIAATALYVLSIRRRRKIYANAPLDGDCVIVFTDVQESTKLWNKSPEIMKRALQQHNDVMRRLIDQYEGYECKTQGDSFMIAFKSPLNAVQWMLKVQMELLLVDWDSSLLGMPDAQVQVDHNGNMIFRGLRIRMGAHLGRPDVMFDKIAYHYDYYGNDVNLSARVSSAARGGQILISRELFDSVESELTRLNMGDGGEVCIKYLGAFHMKGIEGAKDLIEVLPFSLQNRQFEAPTKSDMDPSSYKLIPIQQDTAGSPTLDNAEQAKQLLLHQEDLEKQ